jgi:hypothetical protein
MRVFMRRSRRSGLGFLGMLLRSCTTWLAHPVPTTCAARETIVEFGLPIVCFERYAEYGWLYVLRVLTQPGRFHGDEAVTGKSVSASKLSVLRPKRAEGRLHCPSVSHRWSARKVSTRLGRSTSRQTTHAQSRVGVGQILTTLVTSCQACVCSGSESPTQVGKHLPHVRAYLLGAHDKPGGLWR